MSSAISPISAPQHWNQTLSQSLSQSSGDFFRLLNALQAVDPDASQTASFADAPNRQLSHWQSQYFHQADITTVRLLNALYDAPIPPITHKNGFPHSVHHNLSYALQRQLNL